MKKAIRKIFNKYCTQVNMDYNEYIVLKPDEFIKELAELFASLNPERVKIAFNEIRNEITAIAEYIDSKGGIDGIGQLEDLSAKIDNINISDLCFGSQEEEQNNNRYFPGAYMGDKTFNQPE